MSDDPYLYPDTWVLRNVRNIRDIEALQEFEAKATAVRILELGARPIQGKFDRLHLQRIHKHIFQDVYPWAGQLRTVEIRKEDSFYFARTDFIKSSLDDLFTKLERKGGLHGLDARAFQSELPIYWVEINAVHPFREGNGRAQQEFIRELAASVGHDLSWSTVSREAMYRASARSFASGDSADLAVLLRGALVVPDRARLDFVDRTVAALRAAKTTALRSAIEENHPRSSSTVRGRVVAIDDRFVAVATGAYIRRSRTIKTL